MTAENHASTTVPSVDLFVIGPDEFNLRKLETVECSYPVHIRPLLDLEDVTSHERYDVGAVLDRAEQLLRSHRGTTGGVIGFWDFPVSLMVPILARRLNLTAPSFESVVGCEHKYLSRILQREVEPDHVPAFQSLDPFDDRELDNLTITYPFWIKPVKAFSSHLGFRIRNRRELGRAIAKLRSGIAEIGNAFSDFMAYGDLPEEVSRVDGNHCIIEKLIGGRQCTLEGVVQDQAVHVYGVVDSYRYPNRSSFSRYQYPSTLPRRIRRRMAEIAASVISHIGLDHSAFNMEFFWNRTLDRIWILEINPRISQSHGDLFDKVDGFPHHSVLVDLALGRSPVWIRGKGSFSCAAKVFLRRFRDGTVTRVPTQEEIEDIQRRYPGCIVSVLVGEGMKLSQLDLQDQDSYSFAYAMIFVGASSSRTLLSRIAAIRSELAFEFEERNAP